jgi:hypothetical protein
VAAAPIDAVCLQVFMSEKQVRSARGEARNRAPELRRVLEFGEKETRETRGELQLG